MQILRKLNRFRRRERSLSVVWGTARWLAVVILALIVACGIDWWIDLNRETPYALRVVMLTVQIALAATLAIWWILFPLVRWRSDDQLALDVEERRPEFLHSLISAVQLSRPKANVAGMSPELIAATILRAEEQSKSIKFEQLANHQLLTRALGTFLALILLISATCLLAPETTRALLGRQLLEQRDIPRFCALRNQTPEIWPSGESGTICIRLESSTTWPALNKGEVRITYDDGSSVRIPMQAEISAGQAKVQVPAGNASFIFEAWLGDGRLKQPGRVQRVPRPAVVRQDAWTLLPPHCGTTPSGKPYAVEQTRGDVVGLPSSSAKVHCVTQKPIAAAVVELLGTKVEHESGRETMSVAVLRRASMDIREGKSEAQVQFDLRPEEMAYRIIVTDEYGFSNIDPPRRGLRIVPEEAPVVTLLPEHFAPEQLALTGAAEDFEVEGVPIPFGGSIRVAYLAGHPYGLGEACMFYRINEGPWWPYKLTERPASATTGPFDSRHGAFAQSGPGDQVQFHAVPSQNPEHQLSRTEGGGRFDFQTRAIPELKVGDRLEFYVEVTNREPGAPHAGRSETRLKAIVTVPQLVQWIDTTLRQEDRIRQLEQRQRGVFAPASPPK